MKKLKIIGEIENFGWDFLLVTFQNYRWKNFGKKIRIRTPLTNRDVKKSNHLIMSKQPGETVLKTLFIKKHTLQV